MKPEVWGPHAWIFLHSITLEYPDYPTGEDKRNMSNFMNSLKYVLPCEKCRINFENHLEQYPLTNDILSSKSNLIKWLIDIHNSVNKMNNKRVLSYEESLKGLLKLYDCNNNKSYMIIYIFMIILFITICVCLFKIFIK